jgi:hypothetical protein
MDVYFGGRLYRNRLDTSDVLTYTKTQHRTETPVPTAHRIFEVLIRKVVYSMSNSVEPIVV